MARLTEPTFVKSRREQRGLTQAELGDAADTTGAVIRLLEAGEHGLSVAARACASAGPTPRRPDAGPKKG